MLADVFLSSSQDILIGKDRCSREDECCDTKREKCGPTALRLVVLCDGGQLSILPKTLYDSMSLVRARNRFNLEGVLYFGRHDLYCEKRYLRIEFRHRDWSCHFSGQFKNFFEELVRDDFVTREIQRF